MSKKTKKRAGKSAKTAKRGTRRTKDAKAAKEATRAKRGGQDGKRLSALDAAVEVLRKTGTPMRCHEMIAAMQESGLWTSPKGKTPHATLAAAILREISKAVDSGGNVISRFRKVERGQFAFNTEGA